MEIADLKTDDEKDTVNAENNSDASVDSLPKTRASAVLRGAADALRLKTETFKASAKMFLVTFLIAALVQGVLQISYHWILANVLSSHTGLHHSYFLVSPPMIWYGTCSALQSRELSHLESFPI